MKITVELLRKKKLQGFVMACRISPIGPAMGGPTFFFVAYIALPPSSIRSMHDYYITNT